MAQPATAQATLGAAQLLVTDAQCRTVKIATSLSAWHTELTEVHQDEQQNNKNIKLRTNRQGARVAGGRTAGLALAGTRADQQLHAIDAT